MKRRPNWWLICALCIASYYAGRCAQYARDYWEGAAADAHYEHARKVS